MLRTNFQGLAFVKVTPLQNKQKTKKDFGKIFHSLGPHKVLNL